MCGIVGLYLKKQDLAGEIGELFASMLVCMTGRGPDSAGFAIYKNEDNKIYKLVYRLKETKRATEICNYSKTIKIDCYVKKK